MRDEVIHRGGMIERVYACTHTPERGCACRKPATELFHRAGAELELRLGGSFMVGDSEADVQAARAVQSQPILITDNGPGPDRGGVPVARNLMGAVQLIAEIHSKQGAQSCS
jgi:D-glycero-D-manno-heptose 1,7-bisphosphate phosphatase